MQAAQPGPGPPATTKTELDSNNLVDRERDPEAASSSTSQTQTAASAAGQELVAEQASKEILKLEGKDSPQAWSKAKKRTNNAILGLATFALTYSSSIFAPSLAGIQEHYDISREAALVPLSLFVLGFGLGPFLAGPTSEVAGRRPIYVISYGLFTAFSWGAAYAPNYAALIIFRLLAGMSGASSLNNHPASISDFTSPSARNRYTSLYATLAFLGASMAPLIGGFVNSRAGWRWNLITTAILVTVSWLLILVGVEESYAPVLLARKNKHMARHDGPSLATRYRNAIVTPFKLLFTEPILALVSFYLSFLYAVFYALFPVFPIIYIEIRGWSQESLALSYIALSLGFAIGGLVLLYGQDYAYNRAASRMPPGQRPPPDARFAMLFLFNWTVPVGIFIIAFCSYAHLHWFGDMVGMFLFSFGTLLTFTGLIPFTVDLYLPQAASALAAQVSSRAILAAAFPLFSTQMYRALGVPGASSLLAGIAVILTPMPFIFKKNGQRLWGDKVVA